MSITLTFKVSNSTDSEVRTTTAKPIFSWDFEEIGLLIPDQEGGIESQRFVEQNTYEIRVSTVNTNHGTASFSGTLLSTGAVDSTVRHLTYNGTPLVRGTLYYGQIEVTDNSGDTSDWQIFTFRYNSIPVATVPDIFPNEPVITDDLDLSYGFTDADNDVESGSKIRWFKNGVHVRDFDDETSIDSRFLSYGDVWMADILPSDGYEYGARVSAPAVTVAETSPVAEDVVVKPENPNENDILMASYKFVSDVDEDSTKIRWFINGALQSGFNDKKFIRTELSIGDKVKFEVTPFDGATFGTTISSPDETIVASDFLVSGIRIDGQVEPLGATSARPILTWDSHAPAGRKQEWVSVKVGTFVGADNILDTTDNTSRASFRLPAGILEKGRDYYVSLAISDTETFDKYTMTHFRMSGSRWNEDVSNATGWTIEASFLVDQSAVFDANKYQVVRFQDGSRFGEVRIFADRLAFVSETVTTTSSLDMAGIRFLTITGMGDDVNVYLNRTLAVDGTGLLTQESTSKKLELGTNIDDSLVVTYKSVSYTTSGANEPAQTTIYGSVLTFAEMQFHPYVEFVGQRADAIEGFLQNVEDFKVVGVNPRDEDEGASIYLIAPRKPQRFPTANRTFTPITKIRVSPNGDTLAFGHARGATLFKSYPIPVFDDSLDLSASGSELPNEGGWELYQNVGVNIATFDSVGLVIDTSFENIGVKQLGIIKP